MTRVAFIRHGPTAWNRARRLQGQSDIPLDDAGRDWVRCWQLPPELHDIPARASPLSRARETAEILLGRPVPTDPRLMEIAFGDWEGETIADLRARLGDEMTRNEAKGWRFQPPGGESPAQVFDRVADLLREVAADGRPHLLICHRTVIRCVYARAIGWDLTDKPPEDLIDGCVHYITLDTAGAPIAADLNQPMVDTPPPLPPHATPPFSKETP